MREPRRLDAQFEWNQRMYHKYVICMYFMSDTYTIKVRGILTTSEFLNLAIEDQACTRLFQKWRTPYVQSNTPISML